MNIIKELQKYYKLCFEIGHFFVCTEGQIDKDTLVDKSKQETKIIEYVKDLQGENKELKETLKELEKEMIYTLKKIVGD